MKKLFIAALLTVTVATTAFTADEKKINTRIKESFKTEFADVENVTWSLKENYARATFILNGKKMDAFYDLNGQSIGTTETITLESLPLHAKRTFAKKYSDYTVKEAIKFQGPEETAYFISAENEKHSLILKVTGAGISIFRRSAKN